LKDEINNCSYYILKLQIPENVYGWFMKFFYAWNHFGLWRYLTLINSVIRQLRPCQRVNFSRGRVSSSFGRVPTYANLPQIKNFIVMFKLSFSRPSLGLKLQRTGVAPNVMLKCNDRSQISESYTVWLE